MQTITLEITNSNALKVLRDLEEKHFIKIIDMPKRTSLALPGNPLTSEKFREWIGEAEKSETMSLQEAKEAWQKETAHLLNPGN
jgi:hypothetical protein